MRWTDESGGAYGQDPPRGSGHGPGYGHEHTGDATAGTATMPPYPAQQTQWARPAEHHAPTDPYATGPHRYEAGPDPATAAWDAPVGDVLAVPVPGADVPGPVTVPDSPESDAERPVFVDSSGRRQRRVLRVARLLVIPAGGYVALLISSLLGGPSISSPFVPLPDSPHRATPRATAPDSPTTGHSHSAGRTSPGTARETSAPSTASQASGPSARSSSPATSTTSDVPTPTPATTTTTATTPGTAHTRAATPNAGATQIPSGRAIGSSHKPVK